MGMLITERVRKVFGGLRAVDGVSLTLERGELRAVIGPNGAGKTTLFNLISGYYVPDEGRVFYKGQDITGLPPYRISRMGITRAFQIINIFPRLTALESVQLALLAKRGKTLNLFSPAKRMVRQEAMRILEIVGLDAQAEVVANALSHGDRRVLELALALAGEPELILLDEPMAGMSPWERVKVTELIKKLRQDWGITVFFCEHDMDVVFGISEKITVMHQGRVLAEGKPEEVKRNEEVRMVYLGEAA
ncbi:MAG: ABC transporter ATP-binding protein [Candidatus Methylomirabilales bacterium]